MKSEQVYPFTIPKASRDWFPWFLSSVIKMGAWPYNIKFSYPAICTTIHKMIERFLRIILPSLTHLMFISSWCCLLYCPPPDIRTHFFTEIFLWKWIKSLLWSYRCIASKYFIILVNGDVTVVGLVTGKLDHGR